MKRICAIFICFFWIAFVCGAADTNAGTRFDPFTWKGVSEDWQMDGKMEPKTYKSGQVVPLILSMRNVTKEARWLVSLYPFIDFSLEIRKADGTAVPYSQLGRQSRGPAFAGHIRTLKVDTGKEYVASVDLAKYFQLQAPGTYTVSARRAYSLKEMFSEVKTDTRINPGKPKPITFTIVP